MPVFIELHKAVWIVSSSLSVNKTTLRSTLKGQRDHTLEEKVSTESLVYLDFLSKSNRYKPGLPLTSTIILQLLHGPICVKTCRMRGSVTSLDRFPTYLQRGPETEGPSLCQTGTSMQTKATKPASYCPQPPSRLTFINSDKG